MHAHASEWKFHFHSEELSYVVIQNYHKEAVRYESKALNLRS